MAIAKKAELIILEHLRNKSCMDGSEIMMFMREMREKGVFER